MEALKFDPRQNIEELDWLIWRMSKARKVLEIGSRFGGTIYRIASKIPKGSLVVSVDKPADEKGQASLTRAMHAIHDEFGHMTRLCLGNSRKPNIVSEVSAHAPYDLIFIDGDHTIEGVTGDWMIYGKMGNHVAFHDIAWRPREDGNWKNIDVPVLWQILKRRFPETHEEKIAPASRKGIGLLWGHH